MALPTPKFRTEAQKEAWNRALFWAHSARANRASYRRVLFKAIEQYGEPTGGRIISGIYNEAFPSGVKDELRRLLKNINEADTNSINYYRVTGRRTPWHASVMKTESRSAWDYY